MDKKKQVRVLIAEDQVLVKEMIHGMLEEAGYAVIGTAADGRQTIEATNRLHPDIIIMDIKMPGMDGIEAAQRISEQCPTPVIILTAYETPELIQRASTAGVGAYLLKPPDVRELHRAITLATARFADMMDLEAYARTVAHDLKGPLGVILGASEWVSQNANSISLEELRKDLALISKSARKTNLVVDSLLALARTRNAAVKVAPVNMANVVAAVSDRLAWLIQDSQAELVMPATWSTVLGHGAWLEEVWINYISNALKFRGATPRIELGETPQANGHIQFWVRDNGPGIPPEIQDRLFMPFVRLADGQIEGHGLGLSIARRIVEKLGGKVGVESTPGQGSTFSFTLPAAPPPTLD
jgi:signal transduction histidine kinase